MGKGSVVFEVAPEGFRLAEVSVRLAQPRERLRWDALMDRHHYLGFKRFAGRGLWYVFEWRGRWIGLAGWQSGPGPQAPDRFGAGGLHRGPARGHGQWHGGGPVRPVAEPGGA